MASSAKSEEVLGKETVLGGTALEALERFFSDAAVRGEKGLAIARLTIGGLALIRQTVLHGLPLPGQDPRLIGSFWILFSLVAFSLLAPVVNAALAFGFARLMGLQPGDAYLLMILCASASYIVAPVLLREGLPEASPARYLTMSMAFAFPLNIVLGIPLYWWVVQTFL